jgi:hypothetical protein
VRASLASAVFFGVLIGAVAVAMVMRPARRDATQRAVAVAVTPAAHAPARAEPERVPLPPDQVRSSELFERNRDMPSDPDLAAEYDEINDEYFSNVLPPPRTRWESGLAELGPMIAENFAIQGLTDGRLILLNPAVEHDPEQRRRALCHEMAHMAVWGQDTGHGALFQERLRELANRGAFKGIAATDEERDALHTRLARDRAAIEHDERALLDERETLDRTSQSAVDGFNDRVRRHQQDVAEYNRLVAEYNLMVAYPDGLARERLQPRADGTRADAR